VDIKVDLNLHIRSFGSWKLCLSLCTEYYLCVKNFKDVKYSKFGTDVQQIWSTRRLFAGRSRVRFPVVSLEIFNWHNPSARNMALGSI